MARKKDRTNERKSRVMDDDALWYMEWFNQFQSARASGEGIGFNTLRRIASVPVVAALLQTRVNQVAEFALPPRTAYSTGFEIRLRKGAGKPTDAARQRAAQYITGLGNRIVQDVQKQVLQYDHELEARMRTAVTDATEAAVLMRETTRKLAGDIGDRTGDWTRDLQRIAATELQAAHESGQAQYLRQRYGGQTRVAKIPNPDACPACKQAYLDRDGRPKVFLLDELEANGSNTGRPRDQWLPTVGPMHPWCHCTLVYVPEGMGFDDEWNLVPQERLPVKMGYTLDDLYKARPHKYIRRVPTGNPEHPWRYIYPSASTGAFGTSQTEPSKGPREVEQVWASLEFGKFKQEWKKEFERQGVKGIGTTDCYGAWSDGQGIAMEASVMMVKGRDDSDETWEKFKKAGMMPVEKYDQEGVLLFRTDHKRNSETYIARFEDKESVLDFAGRLNREDIYTTVYEDKEGWKVMCVFMVKHRKKRIRETEKKKRNKFLKFVEPFEGIDVVLIEGEGLMLPE